MASLLDFDLRTGAAAIDRYLDDGYNHVRGMSSRFAGAISAWLMLHQSENGVEGHLVEIGAFQGRYFIALALALKDGEKGVGVDSFDWPSVKTFDAFAANCAARGLPPERAIAWKTDASSLLPSQVRSKLGSGAARFYHIDGDHSPAALLHDLTVAVEVIHPLGLIVLDDMLHPGYPFLVATVQDFLLTHPDWRVMAIIDREDIVGAAKFVLCRAGALELYEKPLMARYPKRHWVLGGDALGHHCIVLTPAPRLAIVD